MDRHHLNKTIETAFDVAPIVCLLGPRQCGKTTLARAFQAQQTDRCYYFDLEDPTDLARLDDPKLALESLQGLVIIDEVQRREELFPILRVLVDRPTNKLRLLLLGSASRQLIRQSSESLAGRIVYQEITPFTLSELPTPKDLRLLWTRGGFPPSYLAQDEVISFKWRQNYIRTFLEQDIPNLGLQIPAQTLRRFWLMLTHYHGQKFNASEIASALGSSDTTIRRYLDILSGTFMVRQLTPWLESIGKRQMKTPKIYFRDSGIFHALIDLRSSEALHLHPKVGASWEGFALEQIIQYEQVDSENVFYWGVHGQAELDLLIIKGGKRIGYEFKYSSAPAVSASMEKAIELLKLDRLTVVFPGEAKFALTDQIEARGLGDFG